MRKSLVALLGAALAALFILRCANGPVVKTDSKPVVEDPSLSQTEARQRAQFISDVSYDLEFDFTAPGDEYKGKTTITFKTLAAKRDVRVDFAEGTLQSVYFNGQPISPVYNGRYLVVPSGLVSKGTQKLEITFTHGYSKKGSGLVRFQDPIDKNLYVYSDFEPYDANRAFPCFDQPDIKATYTLQVLAPKAWEVVSSIRESKIEAQPENAKKWTFPTSKKFSTYIMSIIAGPYAKWEDKSFRIPLRLFARQSLAKYVKSNEWFPITRHGLDFYEGFFNTAYPYGKYDQILVPEFNSGAMENVAAVTFNENFISRGPKTHAQLRNAAGIILHEMAHMWFGDLVTMRWWGDLWLNESFASFMPFVALAAAPQYPEAWTMFLTYKRGAYFADQLSTTHPVVARVNDTSEAMTNFDAITYGKGAAGLKQLMYTIGEEKFRVGLKNYFEKYAEKNTEYRDFFKEMSDASDTDLSDWQRLWFDSAGLNAVAAQYECVNSKISHFTLTQSVASGETVMRPHSMQLAFLSRSGNDVKTSEVMKVDLATANASLAQAIGKTCPHVVFPNAGDYDYAKALLDERSVNALKYSLNEVSDELLRLQLWYALWDKVRDGNLSFLAFADMVSQESLARDKSDFILRNLVGNSASVLHYFVLSPELPPTEKTEFASAIDQQIWQRFKKARRDSDEQILWIDLMPQVFSTPFGMGKLKALLRGQEDATVDQDRRWEIVIALSRFNDPEAKNIIAAEAKRDPSSKGRDRQIAAEAAFPDWDAKMKWVEEYKKASSTYSFAQLRTAMYNLFPYNQIDLRSRFAGQFFKDMQLINDSKESSYGGPFTALAPSECWAATAGSTDKFLASAPGLKPGVRKNLQNNIDEGARCRKIIAVAKSGDRFTPPAQQK